jgi:hypothetical protein
MNILALDVSCTHMCLPSEAEVMLDVRAEQHSAGAVGGAEAGRDRDQ